MYRKLTLPALACLLVACGSSSNKTPEPSIEGLYVSAQTYEVAIVDGKITYKSGDDATPMRTINLRVQKPVGATGPLPAVVVIHGGGFNTGGQKGLEDWGAELARSGYVAIHFGNAEDEPTSHCAPLKIPADECTAATLTKEVSEGGTIFAPMYSRPQDAKAIYDRLDAIAKTAGVEIDHDRVGALGHSGGSHATMSLAGLVIDVSASVKGVAWGVDPRFKAFVANSPQGVGRLGIIESSWDEIASPVLIQTGSGDATDGEDAASRRDAFQHLKGPNVFEHFIDDATATHEQFALEQDPGIAGNELALARTAVAFFDAQMGGRKEAADWLASDALTTATNGVSTLSRK